MTTDPRTRYVERVERFRGNRKRLRRRFQGIWILSLVSGAVLVAALVVRFTWEINDALFWLIAAPSLLAAVACTPLLLRTEYQIAFAERMADVNQRSIARVDRDWHRLPVPDVGPPDESLQTSQDLDMFGRGSLCHLVCQARTPWGLERIANWIAVPAERDVVSLRQEAVRELVAQLDFRQRLEATASFVEGMGERSVRFAAWIADRRDERWLTPATWIARIQTAAVVCLLLWIAFSTLGRTVAGLALAAVVLINVVFSIALLGRIHTMFSIVAEGAADVGRYRRLIDAAADFSPVAAYLRTLKETVALARRGVRLLGQLTFLSRLQELRFSLLFFASVPLFFVFLLYVFLQFVLLWDFHVAWGLSIWRRRFGSLIDEALQAVGQIEALSSLAGVAEGHPDWTFAQIRSDGVRVLEAQAIGHPLLPPKQCVRNDVLIGPPGSTLVVTGSNMSGKSTLLRAVGTNAVLAQAGGPVCARSFLLPPLRVATVMRVTDSLEAGISLFMAELLGIRRVVDAADRLDGDSEHVLLFLLDEILLGTNTAERQMAAVGILAYLMTKNAIGAVSTHDLDLVTQPSIAAGCRSVYFRESFVGDGEPRMVFDYIMRAGVAPTTNVPFLLKAVGLPFGGSSRPAERLAAIESTRDDRR